MLRRRLMQSGMPEDFVDLGLPSGALWAKGNIVKNGNIYSIGEETDYGCYFSWGNIDGHNEDEGYNFNTTTYNSTAGKSLTANIASNDATHDAALACIGEGWHMPTKNGFQELYDYTDSEWTTINGVAGKKFMKKTDHSVYIFLPAAGSYGGTSLNYRGSYGYYWSSSYYNSSNAYLLRLYSSGVNPQRSSSRYYGVLVRAVMYRRTVEGFVDLGLPSGLLWCTHNIGGTNPEDYGYYFSWGNVDGYIKGSGYDFSSSNYNSTKGKSLTGNIPVGDTYDIARKVMGSPWRLPTKDEFVELCDNTDMEWIRNYNGTGVAGKKFMKKTDHSVYIFLPACGYYYNTHHERDGEYGNYWSSTYFDLYYAVNLIFDSYNIESDNTDNRNYGISGRAVMSKEV